VENLAAWRDASIVLLALEAMVLVLIPGIILYALARGVTALIAKVRIWGPVVRSYFRQAAAITEQVSQVVAAPVIIVNEKSEQVRASSAALVSMIKPRREV
jgi:hypothetical protein